MSSGASDPSEHFPPEIRALPAFDGPFDAFRLGSDRGDVLFASYPGGTSIASHRHPTDNVGVITRGRLVLTMGGEVTTYGPGEWYHVPAGVEHAADFEVDSAEIEFWFEVGD
ncbi:MAG: cupin domain-containing protein, partial [Actinomycetota bacterium]